MRIEMLHLIAFGPFTENTLDFSNGDFQLVFGQNEAGKSSMLRAIEAALFGIPMRSKDTFLHRGPDLRVGALLKNQNGEEISFKRRKGNKGTLRTLGEPEEILADDALDAFLRGIEQKRFCNIHCIDHEKFRAGGQILLNLDGLAGDSLLAASNSTFTDSGAAPNACKKYSAVVREQRTTGSPLSSISVNSPPTPEITTSRVVAMVQ